VSTDNRFANEDKNLAVVHLCQFELYIEPAQMTFGSQQLRFHVRCWPIDGES